MDSYKVIGPVDYDPFAAEPAAPETVTLPAPPAPGSKNVYKRPVPKTSETETVTIPSADTFTLPKVVDEGAAPPEPEKPAAPSYKVIGPVDHDPFDVYDPSSDYALTRGVKSSWTGAGGDMATAIDMPRLTALPENEQVQELLRIGTEKADPKNAQLQVGGVEDIHSFGDAATFLGESIGSVIGSWGAAGVYGGGPGAVVGGGLGAAAGATALGAGALPGAVAGGVAGFTAGTGAAFVGMGIGGTLRDLASDPAIQAGLKNGTIKPNEVFTWATGAGAAIGAIDALPAGKFVAKLGGKELTKDAVKTLIRKAVVKGATKGIVEEGGTEGVQQAISEIAQATIGGDVNISERALSVLNAAVVGAVGGAGPGAAGGVVENARIPLPPKEDDQPEIAAVTEPEGTAAAATPDIGQPSPGGPQGTGAAPPPPPGSAPSGPGTTTPVVTPQGGVDPAVGAALGAEQPPAAQPPTAAPPPQNAAAAEQPGVLPEFDATAEDETGDAVADALAADRRAQALKDLWKEEADAEKATTAAAETTTPEVVTGVSQDLAAALATATPATGETLGTGKALAQPQAVPTVPPQPVAPAPAVGPPATAPVQAEPAVMPTPPAPAAPTDLAPIPEVPIAAEFGSIPPQPGPALTPPAVPYTPPASETLQPAPVAAAPLAPVAPLPGAKGAVFKRKKPVTVVIPPKPAAELIKREEVLGAPEGQPVAPSAPVAAPAPARGRLSTDAAKHVRSLPEMHESTVSHLPEYEQTVDDVTHEIIQATPRVGQSPREIIEEAAPKIVAEVKRRLAAAQEAADTQLAKAEEKVFKPPKEAEAEEAEKKLREGKPQERERTGKTGKSAAGLVRESEKATKAAVARELAKPEAERDTAVTRWGELHAEQVALNKKPAEGQAKKTPEEIKTRRAEILAEKAKLQEERAAKVETAEKAAGGLDERAKDMEARVQGVVDRVPLPALGGMSTDAQLQAMRSNLREFYDAVQGVLKASGKSLPDNMNRETYSTLENLAIYARKLISRSADTRGQGATEWLMARTFAEAGDLDLLYGLTTTETLRGGEEEGVAMVKKKNTAKQPSLDMLPRLRRGGAAGAAERFGRAASREAGSVGFQTIAVPTASGGVVKVRAMTQSASSAMRDIEPGVDTGFKATLRNVLTRHLRQLVGDVEVHFVSRHDMQRISEKPALGLYMDPSDEARADGAQPEIFLDETLQWGHQEDYAHTLLHELTHAATVQSLRNGVRGTDKIIKTMRLALERELRARFTRAQMEHMGINYAFTNEAEFLAEAYANENLQQIMSEMIVPAHIRLEIDLLGTGRPPTWFELFTAAVSNAIGMIRGQQGLTYMDQVIRLHPHVFTSSATQVRRAEDKTYGPRPKGVPRAMLPRAVASGPADVQMLMREQQTTLEAITDKFSKIRANSFSTTGRMMRDTFASTGELIRRATEYFGPNSPFETLARLHLKKDSLMRKYRLSLYGTSEERTSEKVELAQRKLKRDEPSMYQRLQRFLQEASANEIDPTVPLTHANNKHVSKGGFKSNPQRERHKRLAREWSELSPAARTVGEDTIVHYRKTAEIETAKHIAHTIRMAVRGYRAKLPAGKTVDDAVAWVTSGAAERIVEEQTPDDKAWHAALKETAKTLAGAHEQKRIRGIYVPFGRKGKYFLMATEKMPPLPRGAIADPAADNRIIFKDRKALDAFSGSYDGPLKVATEWIDPATGLKISHTEPQAKRQFIVTVQNKRFESSDDIHALQQRRDELHAQGHSVKEVGTTGKQMYQIAEQLAPAQVKRLLRNLKGSTQGNSTIGQEAIANAVLDSVIRSMNTPGALATRLKRRKVLGYEHLDLANSTRDYNRSLANHFANTDLAYDLANADQALTEFIDKGDSREYVSGSQRRLNQESMANELRHRMLNTKAELNSGVARVLNSVKDITFLRHLFSPHYSIQNIMQPLMMTYPHLKGKYNEGAVWRHMMAAYRIGGTGKSLGKGLAETLGAGAQLNPWKAARESTGPDADTWWRSLVGKEADGKELQEVFDEIVELGFGAASGIEAPGIAEEDKNAFERGLGRMVNMAKALPERIESINRYTTAIAAYRLARESGLTHEQAKREAVLDVEKTQGGYGAANNPAFFSKPGLSTALQFRKFSLVYGQLFYGAMANSVVGATPEVRKQSRKTLARLALTTTVMAGAVGSPLAEVARMLINGLFLAGAKDDDWDDTEIAMQQWMAGAIKWATGSKDVGEAAAEAVFRGATRLIGVDTSGTFGADNLVLFGQPRDMNSEGAKAWLFDAMTLGAAGTMTWDAMKAFHNGDYTDAIPWPKIVDNMIDAYRLFNWGTYSKTTGEEYSPPVNIGEAATKALGLKPASESRQFEGGTGSKAKQLREINADRRNIMGRWRAGDRKERARIFREDVREWNRTHKKSDERIDMGDLYRSERSAKKYRQRVEEVE